MGSRTSMAEFDLCDRCAAEYDDPSDRRFHAEPVACPECGPRLRLVDRHGTDLVPGIDGIDPVTCAELRQAEERAGAKVVGVETVEFLADVLGRMSEHHDKRKALLRRLSVSEL